MRTRTQVLVAITGTVAGGLILNFLGWVPIGAWLKAAWAGVVAAGTWLGADVTAPRWFVWLLSAVGLAIVGLLLYAWLADNRRKFEEISWHLDYTEDEFHGMRWRWQWNDKNQIQKPWPFCLACDLGYRPHVHGPGQMPSVRFHCSDCNTTAYHVSRSFSDVEDEVMLLIQRNLRRRHAEKQAQAAT